MADIKEFTDDMIETGRKALRMVDEYFNGDGKDDPKVERAFKFLPQAIKMMHMDVHRTLQERSQAIRLLPFLKDEKTREEYIRITQPSATPLLESRPKGSKR